MSAEITSKSPTPDVTVLRAISQRVLWLATAMVDAANAADRKDPSGVKVGGHQASSASMVDIMVALWFCDLTAQDRVSVKPHASPVLHSINYLLGDLEGRYLGMLRSPDGLQSYPSRTKDPDTVDFSTGSVGIGATATLWACIANRYLRSHGVANTGQGRFISLLGDAELDEGAVWEAVVDPAVAQLGEVLWVVDVNRQSLDRIVPDLQIARLQSMFQSAGWEVVTLKWGTRAQAVFESPGGADLRDHLEAMTNEEYQRLLRAPQSELLDRLTDVSAASTPMRDLLQSLSASEIAMILRDLGGHDVPMLATAYARAASDRPTVVFAFTIKGRGLPTEGHPANHSALLTPSQMAELAVRCGAALDDPWAGFDSDTAEQQLCATRADALTRTAVRLRTSPRVPAELNRIYRRPVSTQATFGRILTDLVSDYPEVAQRIVTCSPDVASSTNLGGWINKVGVWSSRERRDWFNDDPERLLKWSENQQGRHIELGIAEVNLVGLTAELGATWSRWGEPLIPIATIYDPFVSRALEPWSFGIYSGGQSILVGTPSGITLAPEGGAHQSIATPSIGLEQPGCTAWEPAFPQDLEWCLLHAMGNIGAPGGRSAYFRLSTRPLDPALAALPDEGASRERRRSQVLAGGYRISAHPATQDAVLLIGVGAVMPEVIAGAAELAQVGVTAGVICVTSADLLFEEFLTGNGHGVLTDLLPPGLRTPIVTVHDGHPHTLAFLGGVRGDRIRTLGVSDFGRSSTVAEAYSRNGLDVTSIFDAALTMTRSIHR